MPNKISKTFDFKKLKRKFPGILSDALNTVGSRLVKSIQDGIDKGKDIKGNSFEPLSDTTKELGGRKPLDRSGKMKKGLKKEPAKPSDLKFIIEMSAESRGEIYGAFHNQGYTNSFKKKQWFKGAKIPMREWFGITKEMQPDGKEYKKAMKEVQARIVSAWSKRR